MSKPVVLIAEELSAATVDALGPDFDIRHVDTLLFGPNPETNEDLVHLASALEILVDAVTRISVKESSRD